MDWLMKHLYRMSTQADRTGMNSRNLAIVWSPNILRSLLFFLKFSSVPTFIWVCRLA
jgi:hypothetical protein